MSLRNSPPFRADQAGSLLQLAALLEARAKFEKKQISADALKKAEDAAIPEVVRRQEDIGLESVTDGEFRRDSWQMDFLQDRRHRSVWHAARGDEGQGGKRRVTEPPQNVATIVSELNKIQTGVKAVEINFRVPTDMLNELASGNIVYTSADPVFSLAQSRAGRIRILGVTIRLRVKAPIELPTMTEQGVPMDITGWWAAMIRVRRPRISSSRSTNGLLRRWVAKRLGLPGSIWRRSV